ncbi:MAG: EF-P lysine aminoacylase EpmA, partial [Pseudomonadota bacterium]
MGSKKTNLWLRARTIHSIRCFFIQRGYLEVETPHLIPAPAPEAHIDAIMAGEGFLHPSPELCMKRLLSANYPTIFQICKVFRHGERGVLHLPEFTLLEWYRLGISYLDLMDECEEMILFVVREGSLGHKIEYRGREIDLQRPWNRISVREAFRRYASLPLEKALELKRFDEILVEEIEPHLGIPKPVFLYEYPASFASLARLKKDDPGVAERFELYIGGLEIANAFSELTDPMEQKTRFEEEQKRRRSLGKRCYPSPVRFLQDLYQMPPSAGIALGIDRLVMIFANTSNIENVV